MKKSFDPTKVESSDAAKQRASNGGKSVKKAKQFKELKNALIPNLGWMAKK